ncbi:uncharacterized protein LOC125036708 [Penaeus chinensis]|uniref:uncharacterized protein LOC125036708 n=1 Tax=Penaeus chinensis TaxID=139456 RepID=UPI001FB63924|nr:uncharacterized protein LOC125036708 [Penaeus chinensis]
MEEEHDEPVGAAEGAKEDRHRLKRGNEEGMLAVSLDYEGALQQRIKEGQARWREQIRKERTAVQHESHNSLAGDEDHAFESRAKRLKARYERDLSALELSEREARARYLEMKCVLSKKEEEIVYLRARLHSHDLEMAELHNMLRPVDE